MLHLMKLGFLAFGRCRSVRLYIPPIFLQLTPPPTTTTTTSMQPSAYVPQRQPHPHTTHNTHRRIVPFRFNTARRGPGPGWCCARVESARIPVGVHDVGQMVGPSSWPPNVLDIVAGEAGMRIYVTHECVECRSLINEQGTTSKVNAVF
jgi:hypothetical protein